MPQFTGFTAEGLAFLDKLRVLQENGDFDGAREWYTSHKAVHERELKLPLGLLVEDLAARCEAAGLPLRGDRKTSLFRIHRDVRFSGDKSPYKTHSGAVLSRDGSYKSPGVFYIHIDPTGCLWAAGFHMPDPKELAKLRARIRDEPAAFRKLARHLKGLGLALGAHEELKRLPRGFEDVTAPDLAAAVKLKGYTVYAPLEDQEVMTPDLVDKLAGFATQIMPLLDFGWEALDRDH
jgi:uncharacterized protein (TIGR02453 family)